MTSCAKGGRKVHDIVTMRDMKGRAVKGRVTSCTSQLRQGLARESWIMGLVFRKSFLYHNFDTQCLLLQMCRIIQKICIVFETHIDL